MDDDEENKFFRPSAYPTHSLLLLLLPLLPLNYHKVPIDHLHIRRCILLTARVDQKLELVIADPAVMQLGLLSLGKFEISQPFGAAHAALNPEYFAQSGARREHIELLSANHGRLVSV